MDANAYGSDSSDSTEDDAYSDVPWVQFYLSCRGSEFFSQIDESYIEDHFNLTGLQQQVGYYEYARDLILDQEFDTAEPFTRDQREAIEGDAEILYGLIHARFIITTRGLHLMREKFLRGDFGKCPRVLCGGQSVLPVGLTDQRNKHSVKLYCPACTDIFSTPGKRFRDIDGAYFGTTFPHMFFLVFPELTPQSPKKGYEPKVFGFKLHETWHAESLKARQELHKARTDMLQSRQQQHAQQQQRLQQQQQPSSRPR